MDYLSANQTQLPAHKSITLKIQAVYFLLTGLWPIVHLESFLAVTGDKTDVWLVYMVSLLTLSLSISLLFGRSPLVTGISSSASFLIIDVVFAAKRVIDPVYLADAVIHVLFIVLYMIPRKRRRFRLH